MKLLLILTSLVFGTGADILLESLSRRNAEKRRLTDVAIEGTSGKLFEGQEINHYNGTMRFKGSTVEKLQEMAKSSRKGLKATSKVDCQYWAVVTTINPPTPAVERQAAQPGWCLVVVGDKKGPFSYPIPKGGNMTIFLDVPKQLEFSGESDFGKLLPFNHFGRKNLGFVYAIIHGAKTVFDFDDDNALISKRSQLGIPGYHHAVAVTHAHEHESNAHHGHKPATQSQGQGHTYSVETAGAEYNFSVINPYPLLGATTPNSWPRGYPLTLIKATHFDHSNPLTLHKMNIPATTVGVIQYLANHDPDVDAIYRLTQPLPLDFPVRGHTPLVMPDRNALGKQVFCPYNAQATIHNEIALWSLLLPITVHGRVSDIWRSYAAQRLFADIGAKLVFSPPVVVQFRNSHNYLADFDSESPLYLEADKLVEQLTEWFSCEPTLPGRMEELWVMLYQHGYLGEKDVALVQAWLEVLVQSGYTFPVITNSHASCKK